MEYDLVIIGGGIHGAGTAQAAAAAGYRTLLLEQTALASGTSSRSSKLIHGGLRYLETGQFGLVRESLRERAILLRIAPELVRLIPFNIPLYRTTRRRPWQIRAGLVLYAGLAGLGPTARFRTLPHREFDHLDGLDAAGLQAVFRYQDAQTDDAALTRAVMRSAIALGAELAMPARFTAARFENAAWTIEYLAGGRPADTRARLLINAAGPWAAKVLAAITPRPPPPAVELVRGTHIALPGRLAEGAYYLEAPADGRAVFALPHGADTLVGTTEAPYRGDPAEVRPSRAECAYLCAVAGHYFPRLAGARPSGEFAGLRVLPAVAGRPFGRSRETLFAAFPPAAPRLFSIIGGKLTTYRASAEKLVRCLAPHLPKRQRRGDTRTLPLTPD